MQLRSSLDSNRCGLRLKSLERDKEDDDRRKEGWEREIRGEV